MTEKGLFNTPHEEAVRLAEELRDTKAALRDIAASLNRIEARVRRAFPSAFPKREPKPKRPSGLDQQQPSMSAEAALDLYNELVEQTKRDGVEAVRQRLTTVALPNLALLRRELGVSLGKKKSSVRAEVEAILGRLNESVMLTQHADRQQIIARSDEQR